MLALFGQNRAILGAGVIRKLFIFLSFFDFLLFGVNLSLLGPYEANFLVAVEKFSRVYSF